MTRPGLYGHWKGGLYSVLFVAKTSTNGSASENTVVYVSMTTGKVLARDEREFAETVQHPETGLILKRFTLLQEYT